MTRQIYQVRIALRDVVPEVWRRVALPGGYTLDRVHRAIQLAVGWQDCHLHSFAIGGAQYGQPDPESELEIADELDVRLDAVVGKDSRFAYVYDFGDWWEHEVVVEQIAAAEPDARYPICLAGENACPPEDVGGPYGYAGLLAALADPRHPDHDAMREWVGRPFDPGSFDPYRATVLLRRMV
jgi:hypothetical protein